MAPPSETSSMSSISLSFSHQILTCLRSTKDCFTHDICSYFENASGGASDPNCGAAYSAAVDDTLFGIFDGCSGTNPNVGVIPPSGQPVCV